MYPGTILYVRVISVPVIAGLRILIPVFLINPYGRISAFSISNISSLFIISCIVIYIISKV